MAKSLREIVPLNELSKKTLGSYAKKALPLAIGHAYWAGDADVKENPRNLDPHAAKTEWKKSGRKETGINRSVDRLQGKFKVKGKRDLQKYTAEETDPLDEISKHMLGSYLHNAIPSYAKAEHSAERGSKKSQNIQKKRGTGIERAIKKLGGPDQWNSTELWKKNEPHGPGGPRNPSK